MLLAITSEGKLGLGVLAGASSSSRCSRPSTSRAATRTSPATDSASSFSSPSLLFVGTMAGVIFFAAEEEEAHGAEATETHGTETGEEPATTEAAPSEPAGDAAAGEAVFASAGCGGCHTLEAAGSSGNGRPEPRRGEARRTALVSTGSRTAWA